MAGEISIYGVFFPLIQFQGIVALVFFFLLRKAMVRVGLYQWVWHPALFDIAFYGVLLFVVFKLTDLVK
ncbi:DUF1656 domain-containing protein [Erwinia endophytica]|uniref:DUF1656 domain-containing protein n=1 Tax=Erwinia endophytica TaxID=1563158 RepID=UPI00186B5CAC|nr:DUF1656 domain-containing protein [Erwinia endophytica]